MIMWSNVDACASVICASLSYYAALLRKEEQPRALCHAYALEIFAFQKGSLALGLLETVHAKGNVVLGKNYFQTYRHRFQHTGKNEGQWSRNRRGNGEGQAQDRYRGRKYHRSIQGPELTELLARSSPFHATHSSEEARSRQYTVATYSPTPAHGLVYGAPLDGISRMCES